MRCERGFTVIEALIACAIMVVVAFVGLAACKAIAQVTARSLVAGTSAQALDAQISALQNDAATALGVYVPPTAIDGRSDAGSPGGHELDFYSQTDDGTDLIWKYVYDAARQTVERFDCDPGGVCGVRDTITGRVDVMAAYPPLRHIVSFRATAVAADALGDPARNAYSGIAALFAQPSKAFSVTYNRPGLSGPPPTGGNSVVEVTLATSAGVRRIHLLAGTMPSGFTVTGLPLWHAVVFRVDQTHRYDGGPFGKSHVFINAAVDVTYDRWQTRIRWCTFNLLGDPHGLDGGDPHANYTPKEPIELSENILAACQKLHPRPPKKAAPDNPPEPSVVAQALPQSTPPPCWTKPGPAGRCWPADAPPDWNPPAPLPADTPPPAWCASHAQSDACRPASQRRPAG